MKKFKKLFILFSSCFLLSNSVSLMSSNINYKEKDTENLLILSELMRLKRLQMYNNFLKRNSILKIYIIENY